MDVVIVVTGGRPGGQPPPVESPYARLPEQVSLADTVATQDVLPHPTADQSGDPERDFMLRYAG